MAKTTTTTIPSKPKADRRMPDDFVAIQIGVASAEEMLDWSYGEVTKPETINYRTLRPEKDGLFDERIFGPTKDYECYCGKYKKVRYKGVVCDKCGVEVTRASVRRERMGHIELAAPVTHIWFLRSNPSRIALLLDVPSKKLEQVVYFASYIVLEVDDEARKSTLAQVEEEYKTHIKNVQRERKADTEGKQTRIYDQQLKQLKGAYDTAVKELNGLHIHQIISELEYRDLSLKYGNVFKAGIGAEAILSLLEKIDLKALLVKVKEDLKKAVGALKLKRQKQLRLLAGLSRAEIASRSMCITVLPVIPPDLRPMVQLDGGRFATSDLNDLYRRVINRNNRLKKLIEIGAPDVIQRNEKRMLQEAVDALFDASIRETATTSKRKLRSLADMLRGKQGRFRQNLLGKRVDYSGRSVIVVGPTLKLDECGVPKTIALELFRPFVIAKLMLDQIVHNVKTASKMVERGAPEVWDALDEVIKGHHVLLNRAPTLHRLSIQAFKPVLVEGKAIQLHPLTTSAFNADFDGDQMAIHLPLSQKAQDEAREIMLSSKNLLKPATGEPITVPSQDMVLGIYFLTLAHEPADPNKLPYFRDYSESEMARVHGKIGYHTMIKVPVDGVMTDTTIGRLLFNQVIPTELGFTNDVVTKRTLKKLINQAHLLVGPERTSVLVDDLKNLGFRYSTISGASFSAEDIESPKGKDALIDDANAQSEVIKQQFKHGLITADERRRLITKLWGDIKDDIEKMLEKHKDPFNSVNLMVDSGARGDIEQVNQIVGMKGLVVNPAGRTIELPIKSNFKDGFSALEYFISTHGARKGLADTALKTSDAGYLTRRLVDVSQDVVVTEEDCATHDGFEILRNTGNDLAMPLNERLMGRYLSVDTKDGAKILGHAGQYIDKELAVAIEASNLQSIIVRSPLTCRADWGICQKCYGMDLATGKVVQMGEAVGIVAAQSIGEPGTQLTMRTFHTGGVASVADITMGLPRVEQLFEARKPKTPAILAEHDGKIEVVEVEDGTVLLKLLASIDAVSELPLPKEFKLKIKKQASVKKGDVLFTDAKGQEVTAQATGEAEVLEDKVVIAYKKKVVLDYPLSSRLLLKVQDGDKVSCGDQMTEGQYDLKQFLTLKGEIAVKRYIIDEIQSIYLLQGQNIHDKHVEIIVRQMFSKVRIKISGDSEFIVGEVIERLRLEKAAEELKAKGKKPPKAEYLLLGVTRASLNTESFLSSASFQETTRVLVDAATMGKIDYLRGLKENVIIGRLIPAGTGFRLDPDELTAAPEIAKPE